MQSGQIPSSDPNPIRVKGPAIYPSTQQGSSTSFSSSSCSSSEAGFTKRLYQAIVEPSVTENGEKLFQDTIAFLETRGDENSKRLIKILSSLSTDDKKLVLLFNSTKGMIEDLSEEKDRKKDSDEVAERLDEMMLTAAIEGLPGHIEECLDLYNNPLFALDDDTGKKILVTSLEFTNKEIPDGVQAISKALQLTKKLSPDRYRNISDHIDGFILGSGYNNMGRSLGGASSNLPGYIFLSYPFFEDPREDIYSIYYLIAVINEEADHNKMITEGPYDHELVAENYLDYKLSDPSRLVRDPTIYKHILEARASVSTLGLLDKCIRQQEVPVEEKLVTEQLWDEEMTRLHSKLKPLGQIEEKMLTKEGKAVISALKSAFDTYLQNPTSRSFNKSQMLLDNELRDNLKAFQETTS